MTVDDFTRMRQAHIARVQQLGPGLARVDLEGAGIGLGVAPGRFAMVAAPGRPDCILPRPLSYFLAPSDHQAVFLVRAVGKGTHALLAARVGTAVPVLGPLGNQFPVVDGACWVVAGGVGAGPWGGLAGRAQTRIFLGARQATDTGFATALREEGGAVEIATDDGSVGFAGTVVDLVANRLAEEAPPQAIMACGPTEMMERAAGLARSYNIPCWVSLEERMACGFGVCRGCAHRDASGGWRCICEDGPVYEATTIFGGGQ